MRGYGNGSVAFEHREPCKSPNHRICVGRWAGTVYAGTKRLRATAPTEEQCWDRLRVKKEDAEQGIVTDERYTVEQCVEDWLTSGMNGRGATTVRVARSAMAGLTPLFGRKALKKLTVMDVSYALQEYGVGRSDRTVLLAHGYLTRAIRFAEQRGLVRGNVAQICDRPGGTADGRPPKSLTLEESAAVLRAATGTDMDAYIYLSIMTGIRTEEIRALRWENVDLDSDNPGIDVVRAVRVKGALKNRTSRRGLDLPALVVESMKRHRAQQAKLRLAAGRRWTDSGLVFPDKLGREVNHNDMRYRFRLVLKKVPGLNADEWTPRDLRHTFVSIMDENDVSIREISKLVGHSTTRTTEGVYAHALKVRRSSGARVMDDLFAQAL